MELASSIETIKKFCPLNIIKNLGGEAIWMYQTAQQVKASVAEMTFEPEELSNGL